MTRLLFLCLLLTGSGSLLAQSTNAGLRTLLSRLYTEDQKLRKEYVTVEQQYGWGSKEAKDFRSRIGQANAAQLRVVDSLISKHGYPGRALVGQPLDQVAFMVIQQSNDRAVHEKYLPIVTEAAMKGQLDRASVAFLTDQVKVQKGEKQIYGTQVRINNAGGRTLYPIEDESNIDRLRKEMDLEPLSAYRKRMGVE